MHERGAAAGMPTMSLGEVVRGGRLAEVVSEEGFTLRYRPELQRPSGTVPSSRWTGRARKEPEGSACSRSPPMAGAASAHMRPTCPTTSRSLAQDCGCRTCPPRAGDTYRTATASFAVPRGRRESRPFSAVLRFADRQPISSPPSAARRQNVGNQALAGQRKSD